MGMKGLRVVTFLVVVGCMAPTAPRGAVRLQPIPTDYALWWEQVEQCSGQHADFARAEWFIYTDRDVIDGTGRETFVDWRTHRIYVTRASVNAGPLVRRAILVYLLPGANSLPDIYAEMCARLIS